MGIINMAMTKPPIEVQQTFWNEWNAANREASLDAVSTEQGAAVLSWLRKIGGTELKLIEVGCGTGWLCSKLQSFGHVTGVDLSDQVLARAAERVPSVKFMAGDF